MALPTHRAIDAVFGLYMLGWGTGPLFRAVYAERYVEQKDHGPEDYSTPAAEVPGYNDEFVPQTPTYVTL